MTLKTPSHSISKTSPSKSIAVDTVPLSQRTIERIEEAKRDLKESNVCTLEELKAELVRDDI
jgi:hypothetical protein